MPTPLSPRQRQTVLWMSVAAAFALALLLLAPVLTPFVVALVLASLGGVLQFGPAYGSIAVAAVGLRRLRTAYFASEFYSR